MGAPSWLWIVFTLLAAVGQVVRNALQKSLTTKLGTAGATHVRFLYGLPFGLLFLAIVYATCKHLGIAQQLPQPQAGFWAWILLGAVTQMIATGLMLAAMKSKSLVITTAYIKTEPVQVAVFAAIFLGDRLSPWLWASVNIATAGVVMMSWPKAQLADGPKESGKAMAMGLAAAAFFALASVGFRGAVINLGDAHFVLRASFTLALGLTIQTTLLTTYLLVRERQVLVKLFQLWRPSLAGGFTGAFSSQMWYIAFALATVAQVRTLALVEIFFALIISKKLFSQDTTAKELLGMSLIALGAAGVTLLQ